MYLSSGNQVQSSSPLVNEQRTYNLTRICVYNPTNKFLILTFDVKTRGHFLWKRFSSANLELMITKYKLTSGSLNVVPKQLITSMMWSTLGLSLSHTRPIPTEKHNKFIQVINVIVLCISTNT